MTARGDLLTKGLYCHQPSTDCRLKSLGSSPGFGLQLIRMLLSVLSVMIYFKSTQAEMVDDILVLRSPGELLVSQSELLGKSDILPYQPVLGGAWSEYDIDITAGGPIKFSPVPSMIITDATEPSTRIFSLLLGKTSKKRYLIMVSKKQMTILDVLLGQDINYTVTPSAILDQGECGGPETPDPLCTFDPGSFNFVTIQKHVVFVCDVIKGRGQDAPVWLATWSIELELPQEEKMSSAYLLLTPEEHKYCNDTKNVLLPEQPDISVENLFVFRHCYKPMQSLDFQGSPMVVFKLWDLGRDDAGRQIIRFLQRYGTYRYIRFTDRTVKTEFELVQILVLQQVAVFITRDFIAYQDLSQLVNKLRSQELELELKFSTAEPSRDWRRLQCNYMGPVTGCGRIIGNFDKKQTGYDYNLSFIEFSVYEGELVQSVTYSRTITFSSPHFAENLRFVGFRRNLLVLCGEDSLMFNRLGGGFKAWNFSGIKISKMVDYYFDEGPGSLLDGYIVFGFLNNTNPRGPTEEFRLAKITVPYFHFKSYVNLAESTCSRYISNCTELDIEFTSGRNRLTKKVYLIDSTFNSLLQRQPEKKDMQIVTTSEVTEIDISRSFYGPVFQPVLSLDQAEFNSRKDLKLSKQPRNAVGKVVIKNVFAMNLEKAETRGDIIEDMLPHAITMKYQKDGWKRFGLFVRYYKKPPSGPRRVFIRAIMVNIPPEQKGGLRVPGSRISWIELDGYLAMHNLNDSNVALYPVQITDFGSEATTTLLALTSRIDLDDSGYVTSRNFSFCFIVINTENVPSKQVLTSEHLVRQIPNPQEPTPPIQVYSVGGLAMVMYLQNKNINSFQVRIDRNLHLYSGETTSLSVGDFFPQTGSKALQSSDILDFRYCENIMIFIFAGRPFQHKYHVVALINLYRSKKSGSPAGIILLEEPDYQIFFHAQTNKIVILYPATFRIHEVDLDQDLLKNGQGSEFEPFTVASRLDFTENQDLFPLITTLEKIPNFSSRSKSFRRESAINVIEKPYIVLQSDIQSQSLGKLTSKLYLVFKLGTSHSIMLNKLEIGPPQDLKLEYTYMPVIVDNEDSELITLLELDRKGVLGRISLLQPSVTLKVDYSDFFSDDKDNSTELRFTVSDLGSREFGQKVIASRTQRFSIESPASLSSKQNKIALDIENLGLVSKVEFGCNGDSDDGIYSSRQLDSLTCITKSGTPYEVDIKRAVHHEASLFIDIHKEKQVTELLELSISTMGSNRKFFLTNADDYLLVFESSLDQLQTLLVCSLPLTRDYVFSLKNCPKIAHVYEYANSSEVILLIMCSDGFEYYMLVLALPIEEIETAAAQNKHRSLFLRSIRRVKVSESIWDAIVVREEYDVLLNRLFFLRTKVNLAGKSSKYIIKVYTFESNVPDKIHSLFLVGTSFSDKYDTGDIVNLALFGGSFDEKYFSYSGYLAKYKYTKDKRTIEISVGKVTFKETTFRFDFLGSPQKATVSSKPNQQFSWGDIIWVPCLNLSCQSEGQLLIYMLYDDFLEEHRIDIKKGRAVDFLLSSRLFNGRYRYKGVCSNDGNFRVKVLDQYLTLDCVPFDSEGSTNNLIIYKRPDLENDEQYPNGKCINPMHVLSQDIGYDARNMENLLLKSKDGALRLLRISPHQVINQYRIYDGLQIELQSKKRSFFQQKKVSIRLSNHFSQKDLVLEFNSEPLAEQISDILIAKRAPILVVLGWFLMVSIPWIFIALIKSYWIIRLGSLRKSKQSLKEMIVLDWDKQIDTLKSIFLRESERRKLEEPPICEDTDEYEVARESTKAVRGTFLRPRMNKPNKKSENAMNAQKQKQMMKRLLSDLVV